MFSAEKNSKYFIDYLYNNYKIKPLYIMLSKPRVYVKSYDGQTKLMYFLIEDQNQLEKYNIIRDKISSDIKKDFDRKPLKTKIKLYGDEATDFCDKKIFKSGSDYTFLAVISLDSARKKDEKSYFVFKRI